MKLAIISEYQKIGGGETNLIALAKELSKSIDVTVFCYGDLLKEAKRNGLNTCEIDLSARRWLKGIPIPIPMRGLKNFDVIHAYSINIIPRLFFEKCPIVWTNHGFWERPVGLRAKIINSFVNYTIAVSKDVFDGISQINTPKSIIPLGIDTNRFNAVKSSCNPNIFNITCIGRFQNIKGQDILIDAIKYLADSNQISNKIKLNFIGSANENSEKDINYFNHVVEAANNIKSDCVSVNFYGFQRNIELFLAQANLVVVPSRYESFSIATVEALAAGKPVIAPKIGGPLEIINSKYIGDLFDPESVISLAEKIKNSINNYNQFSPAASIERSKCYSVTNQANMHIDIYKLLLDGL